MSQKQHQNILFEVQQQVCDLLNADSSLSVINFIPENKKSIDFEIENALERQGICGIVITPSTRFQGKYSDDNLVWELPDLTIQIVENVPVARASMSQLSVTGQDASMIVMDVLGKQDYGTFSPVSYNQGEDSGLLVNKCVFKCLVHKDNTPPTPPTPTVEWGTGSFRVENYGNTWYRTANDDYYYINARGTTEIEIGKGSNGVQLYKESTGLYTSTNFDWTKTSQVVHFNKQGGGTADLSVTWTSS